MRAKISPGVLNISRKKLSAYRQRRQRRQRLPLKTQRHHNELTITLESATMLLESVQIGQPKQYGDPTATAINERAWETGFFKEPITTAVAVQATGLDGDGQADLTVHGGPDKAICVYPSEHFPHWHTSLGLAMQAGAFGENFTVADCESSVCIGDTYQAGDVIVQVSQPRQPCWKLARRWQQKNLTALVQQQGKTGWYFHAFSPVAAFKPRYLSP